MITTQKIKPPAPAEIAKQIVQNIIDFSNWQVLEFKSKILISAMKLSISHDIRYWDALIYTTMMENGIICIYTENVKDKFKIEDLIALKIEMPTIANVVA